MAEGLDYCGPVKMGHKIFCLYTFKKFMKECLGGYYLVINSTPIFYDDKTLMLIGHNYKYRMVLGSISNEGAVGTDPVDPYLSHLTDTYYNIFILPFVCACIIERYSNVHNVI